MWWWRARERRRGRAIEKRRRGRRRVNSGWGEVWHELSREDWGEFEGEL